MAATDIDAFQVNSYLATLETKLLNLKNYHAITLTREWPNTIPSEAGVYVIKHNEEIVYVGETGNLRGRMKDLLDSRHHTIRRTLGENLFSKLDDYAKATTKLKFPKAIELLLNEHIIKNFRIAYLIVPLGRKELEEHIEAKILRNIRLNKRGKRIKT